MLYIYLHFGKYCIKSYFNASIKHANTFILIFADTLCVSEVMFVSVSSGILTVGTRTVTTAAGAQ